MNDKLLIYIGGLALITYLTRFPMLLISSRIVLPSWLKRGLSFASVGVFSALTVPPLFFHFQNGSWSPEFLVGGIAAIAVGIWKKHIAGSLAAGVLVIILFRYFAL